MSPEELKIQELVQLMKRLRAASDRLINAANQKGKWDAGSRALIRAQATYDKAELAYERIVLEVDAVI